MRFKPISIRDFIKKHIKLNPGENPQDLKKRLISALSDYEEGVKCVCGNDIWVTGSAFTGNSCFTCITGYSDPDGYYEIDKAIRKRKKITGRKNIDDISSGKIDGLFDDEGYEVNSELIKKPSLCITCMHDNDPDQEPLCNLTRFDQSDAEEFKCLAYRKTRS